jgi:hypothetical protein
MPFLSLGKSETTGILIADFSVSKVAVADFSVNKNVCFFFKQEVMGFNSSAFFAALVACAAAAHEKACL